MRRGIAATVGRKVTLTVAVAALSVSSVIGVLVHRLTTCEQLTVARSELDRQLMGAAYDYAAARKSPARINPPGLPGPVARAVRAGTRVTYLQDGPHPVLWAATQVTDDQVPALSRSYAPQARALVSLDRTLAGVGAAATVLVSAAGLLLGVRAGRRAMAAARTAERIADGDLAARVRPGGRDEIARLSAAVDTMADALGARLEAERRVTADIAHELRTPVAGMSTAVGLLPPGPATDLITRSVRNLRGLVEDVLEVARLDAQVVVPETEGRQVSAMARRAVAGLDEVEVRVVADAVVTTDPRRVERILANLASNALRHGALPVTVEVDGPLVHVRDGGPGFRRPPRGPAHLRPSTVPYHGAGGRDRPGPDDRGGPSTPAGHPLGLPQSSGGRGGSRAQASGPARRSGYAGRRGGPVTRRHLQPGSRSTDMLGNLMHAIGPAT